MKKAMMWIAWIVVAGAFAVIGFMAYMGAFSSFAVTEKKMGPYTLVYEEFIGPYYKAGPVFEKVYKAVTAEGIKTMLGMGVYFDDPRQVSENKLRSYCGVTVGADYANKLPGLSGKFKIMQVRASQAAVIEFPLRNMLSYMIGPMKAYPVLNSYQQEKGFKAGLVYELYDENAGKIFFVMEKK